LDHVLGSLYDADGRYVPEILFLDLGGKAAQHDS
jgi:hypothetical protein